MTEREQAAFIKTIQLSERDLERLMHPGLWVDADATFFTHDGPVRITGPKEGP